MKQKWERSQDSKKYGTPGWKHRHKPQNSELGNVIEEERAGFEVLG